MTSRFVDDDRAYLRWIGTHPQGFVVNAERPARPSYLILHSAACGSISTNKWTNYTGPGYQKIASESLDDITRWCLANVGAEPRACGLCVSARRL